MGPHHYGAPGARSVKITPAAHQHGTAVITFKVSDGVNQTELAIDLTVRPVNNKPSFVVKTSLPDILGAVGNQSIKEDEGGTEVEQRVVGWATNISAGTDSFDAGGQASHIAVPGSEHAQTVSFDLSALTNPDLFSVAPAIDLTTGDLTYTPAHNAFGTSVVTVELKDDGGVANGGVDTFSHSLTIQIRAVNDKPSFDIQSSLPDILGARGNQHVDDDAGAQTVVGWATNVSFGPSTGLTDEGQSAGLSFNLSPTNASLFSYVPAITKTGGTWDLTYTPANGA